MLPRRQEAARIARNRGEAEMKCGCESGSSDERALQDSSVDSESRACSRIPWYFSSFLSLRREKYMMFINFEANASAYVVDEYI